MGWLFLLLSFLFILQFGRVRRPWKLTSRPGLSQTSLRDWVQPWLFLDI